MNRRVCEKSEGERIEGGGGEGKRKNGRQREKSEWGKGNLIQVPSILE